MPYLPDSQMAVYKWQERKTDYLIFQRGVDLPDLSLKQERFSQDPSTYDLIFDTRCSEEKITPLGALYNTTSAPIVREDVLAILQEMCPGDFQAFPTLVRGINPKHPPYELTNYWLINVTNLSGKIDAERQPPNRKYVLLPDHMNGHHLSRLTDDRYEIIVSQTLYKALKKSRIRGLMFEKDLEGRGGLLPKDA